MKKFRAIPIILLWAVLTVFAWFGGTEEMSDSERRPLAQMPQLTAESVWKGEFMVDFEAYSLDQFPMRDAFRQVKSLFHTYVLRQKDNNGIYIADGYAAQLEYPMDEGAVSHALERFGKLYEKYLTDSEVYMVIVPDKGYYLAEKSGHLAMDYEAMFRRFEEGLPWAEQIDLREILTLEYYYRTDTHWRQEKLLDAAKVICDALGVAGPVAEDYTQVALEKPFYGVYYGQAALPVEAETLYYLESEQLKNCTVYDFESGKTGAVYDLAKAEGKDLYEIFLSGPRSLLTIENPGGTPGKELIVFRDSFGSAMVPLLVSDYEKVTLVDIRYIQMDVLDRFVDFHGQDVLFMYSTLVLNNSETIK